MYHAVGIDPQREFECSIRPESVGCEWYRKRRDRKKLVVVLAGFALLYAWQTGRLG